MQFIRTLVNMVSPRSRSERTPPGRTLHRDAAAEAAAMEESAREGESTASCEALVSGSPLPRLPTPPTSPFIPNYAVSVEGRSYAPLVPVLPEDPERRVGGRRVMTLVIEDPELGRLTGEAAPWAFGEEGEGAMGAMRAGRRLPPRRSPLRAAAAGRGDEY